MRARTSISAPIALALSGLLFSGCASGYVQRGAAWGALAGAAIGAGTGALISSENLLGSSTSDESGNIALSSGEAIGAGLVIGVITGAVVGAMVGHRRDEGYERPPKESEPSAAEAPPPAPAPEAPAADEPKQSASARRIVAERSPYLSDL